MSKIHIVCGPQGAGKSTYSKKLSEEVNGVHLSIDNWMWKLYGEDLPKPLNFSWIMERVERCEQQIWSTTEKIAKCGSDVILDLGFMKMKKRQLFMSLAKEQSLSSQLHFVKASHSLRKKRILERNEKKGETYSFEVTPGMFDFMENEFEVPTSQELIKAIVIDTNPN